MSGSGGLPVFLLGAAVGAAARPLAAASLRLWPDRARPEVHAMARRRAVFMLAGLALAVAGALTAAWG